MESIIIELRNWFRTNGKIDFETNKNLPKSEQGKTITYNCKDIDDVFNRALAKTSSVPQANELLPHVSSSTSNDDGSGYCSFCGKRGCSGMYCY